jgi:hypothetical protein
MENMEIDIRVLEAINMVVMNIEKKGFTPVLLTHKSEPNLTRRKYLLKSNYLEYRKKINEMLSDPVKYQESLNNPNYITETPRGVIARISVQFDLEGIVESESEDELMDVLSFTSDSEEEIIFVNNPEANLLDFYDGGNSFKRDGGFPWRLIQQ